MRASGRGVGRCLKRMGGEGMRYWYLILFCVSVSCEFDSPKAAIVSMRRDRRNSLRRVFYETLLLDDHGRG